MTIKRRLFISNILMIVIPIILALIALLLAFEGLNHLFHGSLHDIFRELEPDRSFRFDGSWEKMRMQVMLIALLCVLGLIAVVYLTNRFLIRFVFTKIERPLEMLTQGVHQIKDGNLDHRIVYTARDEFKPVCEDFNEMAVRLKSSVDESLRNEQNRKELIAGISHDLRSPLTSIKGYVEGLIDGVATTEEARHEYLKIINAKTDDVSKMVSQLFLFSKMDTGSFPVNPELLNLSREIADYIAVTRDDYEAKGLSIVLGDIPSETVVFADPTQLRSVFTNILDNSAKYKAKEFAAATVHCEIFGDFVRLFFDDDGPGVREDALQRLFDVFYREDASRSNPGQGSGLGLAIASKMVALMKGNMSAQNLASGGLRIMIELPLVKENEK